MKLVFTVLAGLTVLVACACAPEGNAVRGGHGPPPLSQVGPPPQAYLASAQTPPSPEVAMAARTVSAKGDVGRLLGAMRYVGEHLAYDPAENSLQFDRTSAQLYQGRSLGGCSEFALATLALCRAMGYPSRLALTMNAKWLERTRQTPLSVPNGHGFVEVWAGGRWLLLDPTYFAVYDCHGEAGPYLPGNEILLTRAADFWEADMTSVENTNAILRQAAAAFTGAYTKPACAELGRVDFDYPTAFANLGDVFFDHGKFPLAKRLFRKSAELDPKNLKAQTGLGRCLLEEGQPAQAAVHFTRALELDPGNRAARAGLDTAKSRIGQAGFGQGADDPARQSR